MGFGNKQMWLALVNMILAPVLSTAMAAKGVDPEVAATITKVAVDGVNEAENFGGDGATKKAQVMALVDDALTGVNAATGTMKVDPAEVSALVGQGIDVGIKAVNDVHQATQAAVPPPA